MPRGCTEGPRLPTIGSDPDELASASGRSRRTRQPARLVSVRSGRAKIVGDPTFLGSGTRGTARGQLELVPQIR